MAVDRRILVDALHACARLRILVLGDVMLDVYDFCSTEQSKPVDSEQPGKRAYTAHESIKALGGAGNVAANLASLGAAASLIGVTGDDGHHFTLQKIADGCGIRHCLLRDDGRPTTVKTRIYVDDEYQLRRDDEFDGEVTRELARAIEAEFLEQLDACDAVILSDYDKGFFTQSVASGVITACRDRNLPVVVDFKPPNVHYFAGASIVAPNEGEAEELVPGFRGASDLERPLRILHERLCCDATVVTLGARGLCGVDTSRFFHVPGHRVTVVDAVGCGDTVRAVLALGLAQGLSLDTACRLANCAAATIIQKRATATIGPDEVIGFIERAPDEAGEGL